MSHAYCPRRTVLDYLLVEAAVAAGAELRERFSVEEIMIKDGCVTGVRGHTAGGMTITERARVVVGADGRHSMVANAVQAPRYDERPTVAYYAYWSGLRAEAFDGYIRPSRAVGVAPTNDDLTMVTVNWPRTEFAAHRRHIEDTVANAFALVAELAERLAKATRETRFVGTGDLPNYFRRPYGPGWALVGDAGYHKDPLSVHWCWSVRALRLVVGGFAGRARHAAGDRLAGLGNPSRSSRAQRLGLTNHQVRAAALSRSGGFAWPAAAQDIVAASLVLKRRSSGKPSGPSRPRRIGHASPTNNAACIMDDA